MAFSIAFVDEPLEYLADDHSIPFAIGEIRLGVFRENFASSLYTWSKTDYEAQWKGAIEHLLSGNEKAALMTEYINPHEATHLRWWPMFSEDQKVYF